MANEWIAKDYQGGAVATTLNGGVSGSATTLVVTSGTGLPDGSTGPFVISLDRTTLPASEEKVLCASRSGNSITVTQRGYDGTPAVSHLTLASVEHVVDAHSMKQANAMASAAAVAGSMSYRSGALAYSELPIGASGLPLVSTGTAPGWSALGLSGISAALLEILCPAGTIRETVNGSADTGWALMGQTLVGAQSAYPTLWGKAPAAWKSGANLVLPSMTDRTTQGFGAAAIGANAGANTKVIASGNLPTHTHVIDHAGHAVGTLVNAGEQAHTHTVGGTTTIENNSHTHGPLTGSLMVAVGSSSVWNFGDEIVNGSVFVLFATTSTLGINTSTHTHVWSATSSAPVASHTHSISGSTASFAGSSGNGGFANTALDIQQASLAVVYQIKVH